MIYYNNIIVKKIVLFFIGNISMKTKIFKMTDSAPDYNALLQCADIIKKGGLVAFPTETVYGLGASAVDGLACEKIFIAKKRPPEKALILHMHKNIDASEFVFLNDKYILLRQYFGDGPLTYVLKKNFQLPNVVTAGGDTVAIRFPSNNIASLLISFCGVPIAAPSANISGFPPPSNSKEVIEFFDGKVDAIIDAGQCGGGLPSTIVSLIDEIKILREGAISPEEVFKCLGKQ